MTTKRSRGGRTRVAGLLAAGLAALGGVAARAQDTPGPVQTVTLLVRGPDGKPLRNHALTEFRIGPFASQMPLVSVPTDGLGRATVTVTTPTQFANYGLGRLGVFAPGVGVGMTGVIEVAPGGSATVPVPPLAPFARLSGTVAPDLRLTGETVRLDESSSQTGLPGQTVMVDAQGRFVLTDVPPGRVQIVLDGVAGDVSGPGHGFSFSYQLAPGETRTGVVLAGGGPRGPYRYVPPVSRTVTVRGTVTDDRGQPIAGATVYAQVPGRRFNGGYGGGGFSGNISSGPPPALTATTGADGGYVFPNVALVDPANDTDIPLTAAAPGHAPAFLTATVAATGDTRADLVLSTQRTALTVRVTTPDGKPVPSALVRLIPEAGFLEPSYNGPLLFLRAASTQQADPGNLFANLYGQSGSTGPDGVARFVDLEPGLWDVTATNGPVPNFGRPSPDFRAGTFTGVAIQAGQGAVCALALAPRPVGPTVRVLGPDGKVVPIAQATLEPGSATVLYQTVSLAGPNQPSRSPTGDAPVQDYQIQTGLWHVNGSYRDAGVSSEGRGSGIPEPYNEATALLALSPALPPPGQITLHALHHGTGSLRVQLEDAQGRPARGTVVIPGFGSEVDFEASTDARGEVEFTGLTSGDYTLHGYFAGEPPPSDAAPASRPELLPVKVTVTGDHAATATLRPQPVGYVRVRLRLTPPDALTDFYIFPGFPEGQAQSRLDVPRTSFLVGPFPPGPVTLSLNRSGPVSGNRGHEVVNIVAGRVIDAVLTPSLPADALPPPAEGEPPATTTVYLSDGVTPAWGAQSVVFLPGRYAAEQPERADALGRLQPGTLQLPSQRQPFGVPPTLPGGQDPTTPTLVVRLPGLTGATVLPYTPGRPQKIALPPAINVTGRVTVGGKSAAGLLGTFLVRAEYQGRGRLNDFLSLDATTQPDGTFTLSGLTPGTYLVQAARDGIWLSATQTVSVSSGSAPTAPLTLDVGPPGRAVTLRLTPGQAVTLDRPPGPLTDLLWPAVLRADGLGELRLDGLEAGPHTVRPADGSPAVSFDVPGL